MRKWKNLLISGSKRCFVQTPALFWKSLKRGALQLLAENDLKRRASRDRKPIFVQNVLNLGLKIANEPAQWVRCQLNRMNRHCVSFLLRKYEPSRCVQKYLSHVIAKPSDIGMKTRLLRKTRALRWKSPKSNTPSAKMTRRADLGLKTLLSAQTLSCTLLKTAEKVVHPVRKWQDVPISGWKRCFAQTRALY